MTLSAAAFQAVHSFFRLDVASFYEYFRIFLFSRGRRDGPCLWIVSSDLDLSEIFPSPHRAGFFVVDDKTVTLFSEDVCFDLPDRPEVRFRFFWKIYFRSLVPVPPICTFRLSLPRYFTWVGRSSRLTLMGYF